MRKWKDMKEIKRDKFSTKAGVIAATVGSAIGLGNIWRFPYEAGEHGGGAFLLVYVFFVVVIGVPLMCSEFVVGRASHANIHKAFKQLEKPGRKWHWVAYLGIASALMILSFYSVVAGWTMEYCLQSAAGQFASASRADLTDFFADFSTGGFRPVVWVLLFLLCNYVILRKGLKKGIERISNLLTPLLFVLLIAFCINSLTLPDAASGLRFLFVPDFSAITPSVVLGAMGQAFFSLSLGVGTLITYSSYFDHDVKLVKSASIVAVLDTAFAVLAGIIIFPALFSFGMEPEAGPKLVFEVLPAVFAQMPGGSVWATMFFFLLFVASITSTISMAEIAISFFKEEKHMSREKATAVCIAIAMVFGTLCALSFGPLSGATLFGMTIFSLFDFATANLLMPVCGIFFSIFVGWMMDSNTVTAQLTNRGALRLGCRKAIIVVLRYVAPAAVFAVLVFNLIF